MGELIRYRLIGFSISNCVLPSYIVTDQKALAGGSCPAGNVSVYRFLLQSGFYPALSVASKG